MTPEIRLPEWVQMGDGQEDEAPNMSPFVTALKKRLNHPMMKQGGDHLAVGKIAPVAGGGNTSGGKAPSSL